jgi:mRNA-degrading endonuclease toxin of MazEF toxin-antitoxin module
MKFGDIFICRFPFTSGTTSKPRPALVLFDLGSDAIICRITSAIHAGSMDIAVKDWAAAGLAKPSVIRLNRIVTAEKTLLLRSLGTLSDPDQAAVRTLWNANMML